MKSNKSVRTKTLVIIFILIELITIFHLFKLIMDKRKKILGAVVVNPIHRENIIFPIDSEFKYYFNFNYGNNHVVRQELYWRNGEYVYYSINKDGLNEKRILPLTNLQER